MRKSLKTDPHAWAPRIPKTSLTSGNKNYKILVHYESTEVKQTAAARPKDGGLSADLGKKLVSRATLKGFMRRVHGHGRSRGGGFSPIFCEFSGHVVFGRSLTGTKKICIKPPFVTLPLAFFLIGDPPTRHVIYEWSLRDLPEWLFLSFFCTRHLLKINFEFVLT